jgi:hypothetical protein
VVVVEEGLGRDTGVGAVPSNACGLVEACSKARDGRTRLEGRTGRFVCWRAIIDSGAVRVGGGDGFVRGTRPLVRSE